VKGLINSMYDTLGIIFMIAGALTSATMNIIALKLNVYLEYRYPESKLTEAFTELLWSFKLKKYYKMFLDELKSDSKVGKDLFILRLLRGFHDAFWFLGILFMILFFTI
jgi:hypothetical protein